MGAPRDERIADGRRSRRRKEWNPAPASSGRRVGVSREAAAVDWGLPKGGGVG